jgi:hypothetical protein
MDRYSVCHAFLSRLERSIYQKAVSRTVENLQLNIPPEQWSS